MNRAILILVFLISLSPATSAQEPTGRNIGNIKISIPRSVLVAETRGLGRVHEMLLKSNGKTFIVPFLGRKTFDHSTGEYVIDEYDLEVAPGVYRLVVKGFPDYKLPNFRMEPGKTVSFQIPFHRFALEEYCEGNQRVSPLEGGENGLEKRKRSLAKLKTQTIILQQPFEAVIQHCGQTTNGEEATFSSARLYYKNVFLSAARLVLNTKTLRAKLFGSSELPVEIQIDGGPIVEKPLATIDLKNP